MLYHPMGAGSEGDFRLGFDPRVRLEFNGSKISSEGGLLLFRELDETLGLYDMAGRSLQEARTGKYGARDVRHARKITFQLAEVAVPRNIFGQILAAIRALKPPPRPV